MMDVITTDGLLQTRASQTNFDTSRVLQVGFGDVTVVLWVLETGLAVELIVVITTDGQLKAGASRKDCNDSWVLQVSLAHKRLAPQL